MAKKTRQERAEWADQRLIAMRTPRYSWWVHWRELANFLLPRRYKWLITPNEQSRGTQLNTGIIDSTGTIAARVCAAGMMSGITSPTRPWFRLGIEGLQLNDSSNPASLWLAECEKRLLKVFAESNFYNAMATLYLDLVVFGTGVSICYEDYENVVRFYNPCAGEYYLEAGPTYEVDTLAREFTMTIKQVVQEFGLENCSESTKKAYAQPGGRTQEIVVCHLIEPNDGSERKQWKWMELYWERGNTVEGPLRWSGYNEWPVIAPRWDLVSNDVYGRSPAMDALGDIKQLQQETKRKGQAIDKMVNPPMLADVQLRNQPASLMPGGVTYVSGLQNVGYKPVYTVNPPINDLKEDIKQIQERIKVIFFNDLFMMISQLDTVRTATEIDARREEKLIMLGPVLERFEQEALDPVIERIFGIMMRGGLLPEPPEGLIQEGRGLNVQYVSMLAEAQRAVSASGMERVVSLAGNIAAADPSVLDNINMDEFITEYSDLMGVPPKILRSRDEVAALREQKQKQQQQAALLGQTDAAVKGAQVLSKTDVGGGQNALAAMMGLGGPQGGSEAQQ
jgi:hypothetical protein